MRIPVSLFIAMGFVSACTVATPLPSTPGITATVVTTLTEISSLPTSTPVAMPTLASAVTPSSTATVDLQPFGTVKIDTAEIEFDVNGDGRNTDSISFWEAPDATQSLMFVTSKGNSSIEVYQYPFQTQLRTIACGDASNGVWVDQGRDILYITGRNSRNVCAYDLPGLEENAALSFTTSATGDDSEPNLTMLSLLDGQRRIYVSYDDHVYYHDAETGGSLGDFATSEGLETMYGDDFYQVIYIPDEGDRSGVYQYDPHGNLVSATFGDRSIFDSDAEGIWVYKCLSAGDNDSGEGLIIVADQKDEITDFEVFNRRTKEHLGKINISGVNNTDGISITQQASPAYPFGLLAVIDDDTSTVGLGWDTLLEKTELSCGG